MRCINNLKNDYNNNYCINLKLVVVFKLLYLLECEIVYYCLLYVLSY